jgi:hypothetical protein
MSRLYWTSEGRSVLIFRPGEEVWTLSETGSPRMWTVRADGDLRPSAPGDALERIAGALERIATQEERK